MSPQVLPVHITVLPALETDSRQIHGTSLAGPLTSAQFGEVRPEFYRGSCPFFLAKTFRHQRRSRQWIAKTYWQPSCIVAQPRDRNRERKNVSPVLSLIH